VSVSTLILAAHGSSVPETRLMLDELARTIGRRRPAIPVALAYLEHHEPGLPAALDAAVDGPVTVVPLLLADAFHVRTDIASAVTNARGKGRDVVQTTVLSPHPRLLDAVQELLIAAGAAPTAPVVIAAAGTSDPAANAATSAIAKQLAELRGTPVTAAFLSAATPTLEEALDLAVTTPAVVPWLLSRGRFAAMVADQCAGAGALCTQILGDHSALVDVVWDRYDEAATRRLLNPSQR
jgi:sirohydrochlorin ferrochelatase